MTNLVTIQTFEKVYGLRQIINHFLLRGVIFVAAWFNGVDTGTFLIHGVSNQRALERRAIACSVIDAYRACSTRAPRILHPRLHSWASISSCRTEVRSGPAPE